MHNKGNHAGTKVLQLHPGGLEGASSKPWIGKSIYLIQDLLGNIAVAVSSEMHNSIFLGL